MKPIHTLGMVMAVIVLAGCSSVRLPFWDAKPSETVAQPASKSNSSAVMPTISDGDGEVAIQAVEFRPGTSSATVERLAKRYGCDGMQGAGLLTEKGPVEVYRMKCENGTTFLAQCELRQCRPMR